MAREIWGRRPTGSRPGYPVKAFGFAHVCAPRLLPLIGVAAATNFVTPTISALGLPSVGNLSFSINVSGLVPNHFTLLFIGAPLLAPFDLSIIGGQPGSFLYVNGLPPGVVHPFPTDSGGNATVPAAVICQPSLVGVTISWQVLDSDLTLAFPFPWGSSQQLDTTIGW